jgi:CDP-glycerol glycerophosphotransferase
MTARPAAFRRALVARSDHLTHALVRRCHHLISRWHSSSWTACVYGSPDFEENSLAAAAALAETGKLKVTLLAADPEAARRYLTLLDTGGFPVDVVKKRSVRGLLRASTAGVLLFTHGLYGAPDLTAHKLVVNLWHGFGPKATGISSAALPIRFSLMTCDTPVWAAAAIRAWGTPAPRLVQVGNPRQRSLRTPPEPAALARLGLTPRSYVVWMPTYRAPRRPPGSGRQDPPRLSVQTAGDAVDPVTKVAELARSTGVTVVVKPHPADADRYEQSGLPVLSTEQVFAAGLTLYQFIGASAGMISDYSSVWVEYLDIDRPLLLLCPDIPQYVEGRGLSEPYMTDIARDLIVERAEDVRPFLEAVARGTDWKADARAQVRKALQLDTLGADRRSVASVVLAELEDRSPVARGGGPARRLRRRRATTP